MIHTYNFTNDVPKYKLFVKLNKTCSDERREQLADGIRSFFRDERTLLLDMKEALHSVQKSL
jgi:hypothetical protein